MSGIGVRRAQAGISKSGFCLANNCEHCRLSTCTHGCHRDSDAEGRRESAHRDAEEPQVRSSASAIKPGLHFDLSDELYHGDPVPGGSLSSSLARRLTEYVPAKAISVHRNRKPTKAMTLGKAAHLHVLGAGPKLIVWEHDGRTKAGKEERALHAEDIAAERTVAVTAAERDQVEGMAVALRAHPEVVAMLADGEPEVSAFWQERGAWCRARLDLLGTAAYDYKTTDDASAAGFEHAMATYGYHQQADFYLRGLRALGVEAGTLPMRFICQEKQEPYLVQIHTCDELSMEIAAALNDRAIDIFAASTKSGQWAGYQGLHAEPTGLPARYFYRYAGLIPAQLNPYADTEMSM